MRPRGIPAENNQYSLDAIEVTEASMRPGEYPIGKRRAEKCSIQMVNASMRPRGIPAENGLASIEWWVGDDAIGGSGTGHPRYERNELGIDRSWRQASTVRRRTVAHRGGDRSERVADGPDVVSTATRVFR